MDGFYPLINGFPVRGPLVFIGQGEFARSGEGAELGALSAMGFGIDPPGAGEKLPGSPGFSSSPGTGMVCCTCGLPLHQECQGKGCAACASWKNVEVPEKSQPGANGLRGGRLTGIFEGRHGSRPMGWREARARMRSRLLTRRDHSVVMVAFTVGALTALAVAAIMAWGGK